MTTLTQSDLDDLRQMAMAHQGTELLCVSKEMALFLINRIAQLTVERDEAREYGVQARIRENESEQRRVNLSSEITKRDARIAALEAQLAEAVAHEREECAKIAERDADWSSFGMRQAVGSNPEIFESDLDERNITIYRAGICAGRSIAAVIRARSEQEGK